MGESHHSGVRGKDYIGLGWDYRTMRNMIRIDFFTSEDRIADMIEEVHRYSVNDCC